MIDSEDKETNVDTKDVNNDIDYSKITFREIFIRFILSDHFKVLALTCFLLLLCWMIGAFDN